jgi:hypothetical protein
MGDPSYVQKGKLPLSLRYSSTNNKRILIIDFYRPARILLIHQGEVTK